MRPVSSFLSLFFILYGTMVVADLFGLPMSAQAGLSILVGVLIYFGDKRIRRFQQSKKRS